jgi:hypothetical protein
VFLEGKFAVFRGESGRCCLPGVGLGICVSFLDLY